MVERNVWAKEKKKEWNKKKTSENIVYIMVIYEPWMRRHDVKTCDCKTERNVCAMVVVVLLLLLFFILFWKKFRVSCRNVTNKYVDIYDTI